MVVGNGRLMNLKNVQNFFDLQPIKSVMTYNVYIVSNMRKTAQWKIM